MSLREPIRTNRVADTAALWDILLVPTYLLKDMPAVVLVPPRAAAKVELMQLPHDHAEISIEAGRRQQFIHRQDVTAQAVSKTSDNHPSKVALRYLEAVPVSLHKPHVRIQDLQSRHHGQLQLRLQISRLLYLPPFKQDQAHHLHLQRMKMQQLQLALVGNGTIHRSQNHQLLQRP